MAELGMDPKFKGFSLLNHYWDLFLEHWDSGLQGMGMYGVSLGGMSLLMEYHFLK